MSDDLLDLPEGWVYATIFDLCTLINGKAFKPSDWTETGLPIIRIQNLNNPNAQYNHFLGEVEAKFLVKKGELLFAWSGTPGTSFGAHIWNGEKAVLNQHIFRVLFDDKLINKLNAQQLRTTTVLHHKCNQKKEVISDLLQNRNTIISDL